MPRSCRYPNWCYNPEETNEYSLEWCYKCRAIYKISQRIKRVAYEVRGVHTRLRSMLEIKTDRKTKYHNPEMWGVK